MKSTSQSLRLHHEIVHKVLIALSTLRIKENMKICARILEAHCWLGNQPGYLRQSTINQDTFGQFSDLNHSDSWLHTAAHWLRWHLISCQNTIRKYVNPSVSTPVCYKIFVTANFWMCANHWTIANHRKSLDNICSTHACSMVHVACIICIYVCSNL